MRIKIKTLIPSLLTVINLDSFQFKDIPVHRPVVKGDGARGAKPAEKFYLPPQSLNFAID